MDMYKEFIKELSPSMTQLGFNKKGNNFYLEVGENFGVVNFQKSKESSSELFLFTINFGVYSDVLGQLIYNYRNSAKPEVEQCHWISRIGNFMPGGTDFWWKVNTSGNLNAVAAQVIEAIQSVVLPELTKRLSDEGLIQSWMNESFAGTTEFGRFKYLTFLLMKKRDYDTLNHIVEEFMLRSKGKPNYYRAIEHLKEIGFNK